MAKVLLINGSGNEHGCTFTALSEVAKALNEEGVETEIIQLGKDAIRDCIGCGSCGKLGRYFPPHPSQHTHYQNSNVKQDDCYVLFSFSEQGNTAPL